MNDELSAESSITSYTYDLGPPEFAFEHDPEKRVFRLSARDGSVEVFRDNPTRYLCLTPDEETGAMTPVRKGGKPVYLYLAREEHEIR